LFIAKFAILPVWVLCGLNGLTERGNEFLQTFRWMPCLHPLDTAGTCRKKRFRKTCYQLL